MISDQVVLIANGMIVAEGQIRNVRDEIQEHPSQFIIRCRERDASGVAARLFSEDHVTEIKLNDDRLGMLVMTRDREQFARALGRIALDGHRIESVVPADENVDALYEYLIGGDRVSVHRARNLDSARAGPGFARVSRRGRLRRSSCVVSSSPGALCGCTRWRCCRR